MRFPPPPGTVGGAPAPAPAVVQVEKYRPHTLDDVVGNPEAVDRLKAIARDGNMPNLIFSVRTPCSTPVPSLWLHTGACAKYC